MITIQNVSKTYGNSTILKNINLSIEDGEVVALLGENGSGKSTLIKMLVGVLKSTEGTIFIDSFQSFSDRKKIIKNLGVVFNQKPSFIIDLSVYDNLLFFQTIYEIEKKEWLENLKLINSFLNIEDLYDKPYRKLSFGQRVKCEIVSVLLHNPKYIILDEPTIGLDYNAKQGLYELCRYFNKVKKSTIIIITHEIEYIEDICSRVVILDRGEVLYDGTPAQIGTYFKKYDELEVSYRAILNESLANKIFENAQKIDKEKGTFVLVNQEEKKQFLINELNQAFDIKSFKSNNDDLRGIFKYVLKEIKENGNTL